MKKMRIRIGKDGKTTIKVEGGQGSDCELFTKAVENALGTVQEREFLPEHEIDELSVRVDQQVSEGL